MEGALENVESGQPCKSLKKKKCRFFSLLCFAAVFLMFFFLFGGGYMGRDRVSFGFFFLLLSNEEKKIIISLRVCVCSSGDHSCVRSIIVSGLTSQQKVHLS